MNKDDTAETQIDPAQVKIEDHLLIGDPETGEVFLNRREQSRTNQGPKRKHDR